ncbi:M23 family metallopeptidase [Microbacterium sp. X-17]|uniref:M23 family metallopeptidase n=1 Tax=Microbacterium sp. X-17 TaxID=3144404 RepID=UPI0031F55C5B
MSPFRPLSHTLIAGGLALGLAATSSLIACAAPATAASLAGDLAPAQDLVVPASFGADSFGLAREAPAVHVAPGVVWPVRDGAAISDGFGHRDAPVEGASTEHPGIDFAARAGVPVHAAASGVVSRAVTVDRGGCGIQLAIDHVVRGEAVTTVYCHLAEGSVRLRPGQRVAADEVIGAVGSTGVSTGAHLHFEVRPGGGAPIDPLRWLNALAA